eukprot:TRINITY_DN5003_c0_g1_i1.p1 TRINITY_DN5003_c0_g1~~TRINITY_DN5003_c0_g1_i1.p1  ORF type:complete len:342 (+),score=47.48 TRINITY_DN5003_c0_g1_i1:74-1099(+)
MLLVLVVLLLSTLSCAKNITITGNGWTWICIGNCESNKSPPTVGGRILMGGGTDVDEAFRHLIKNSGGGDILVLRASGTDAYNPYIYALGSVNSVATLIITNSTAAYDPFVVNKIKQAEGLWWSGGDQSLYYQWKNTPLSVAVQELVNGNVTVGGTSAGMDIQASYPYVAKFGSVSPQQALKNPYDPLETMGEGFIDGFPLHYTVTESHFVERDRMGRIVSFLARGVTDHQNPVIAIACDQSAALLVSLEGPASVVILPNPPPSTLPAGTPTQQCYIFVPTAEPEICKPGKPLTFTNITVYRLGDGDSFNFATRSLIQGFEYTLSAEAGKLSTNGNNGNIY